MPKGWAASPLHIIPTVQAEEGPGDSHHPPRPPGRGGGWGGGWAACIQGTVKYFTTKQNYSKE